MKKPAWTDDSLERFKSKAQIASKVLSETPKDNDSKVIDLRARFLRKLFYNNHAMFLKLDSTLKKA